MLLNDGSSKTLMVDERQSVRDVLDNLFEKTHCDCSVDWSLWESNAELQLGELGNGRERENRRSETRTQPQVWGFGAAAAAAAAAFNVVRWTTTGWA